MKKSFLNRQNTAVTALFTGKTVAELLAKTRNAAANGADGIAVEIHNLPPELRTVDTFKTLVDEVPLPFMFICYRSCQWYGSDDEARQEFLLRAAEAGAEVIDVMGDLYCKSEDELTTDPAAIEKQKKLIEEIHARGAKALISSHMFQLAPKSADEVLAYLTAQSDRGADICKIVTNGNTEEAFVEAIRTDLMLSRVFPKPFIHLTGGKYGRLHRFMGTKLGLAATFGVSGYDDTPYNQPLISSFKTVRDLIPWDACDLK
jgi:3-dehydroquinate dehydratase type I